MDVQRREDRFLDYISAVGKGYENAKTQLATLRIEHPELSKKFDTLEVLLKLPEKEKSSVSAD